MPRASYDALPVAGEAASHPELETARGALREHDWPRVVGFFASLPDQHARSFAYNFVGQYQAKGTDVLLAEAAKAEVGTGASVARTLYAYRLIDRGWQTRSALRARYVPRAQFDAFHRDLAVAEQSLYSALLEDPANASAWTASLLTARGLQMSQQEARRRYEQAINADPHHFRAQKQYLQKLAPKWRGSWDALDRFASECMRDAPAAAPNAVFVVDAHLEHWLELGKGIKAMWYLRRARVRNEIYRAAEQSVLHPAFGKPCDWVLARSTFAMVFSLYGDRRAAAAQFRGLGPFSSKHPWVYLSSPDESFSRSRARALAAG